MNSAEYNEIFEEIVGTKIEQILTIIDELNHTQILDQSERVMGALSVLTSVNHAVLSKLYEAGVNEAIDQSDAMSWGDVKTMLHAIVDNDQDAINLLQAQRKVRSIG